MRDKFRKAVFERDRHICVIPECGLPAVDAHHIIERALWTEEGEQGGYLVDNGASVCARHHFQAEKNYFTPHSCRLWAGIERTVLPKQLDPAIDYNKWGEELRQPPAHREYIKYPTTLYFDFSPGVDHGGDYFNTEHMLFMPVVVTTKMDGSNVVMTHKHVAARNGDTANHASYDYIKAIHSGLKEKIPENIQIFGEWLYAKHSIHYTNALTLPSYYQLFAVYDIECNMWMGWDTVEHYSTVLGFPTVPVIKKAEYKESWELTSDLSKIAQQVIEQGHEGIVARNVHPFHYGQFEQCLGKCVREGHIQTDKHWTKQPIIKNETGL